MMIHSMIWGLILIAIGLSFLINAIFGLNIPIFKILLAAFFIYMGIKILMPDKLEKWCKTTRICSFRSETSSEEDKYKVCFTSTTIDLNSLSHLTTPKTVYISAQFAEVKVLLPHNVPVHVKADSTFASVNLPNTKNSSEYVNLYSSSEPMLIVLIDAAFANVAVRD